MTKVRTSAVLTGVEQDPEYELRWPAAVFANEARAVLSRQSLGRSWSDMAERLLEEAFVGSTPRDTFLSLRSGDRRWGATAKDPWDTTPETTSWGASAQPSPADFLTDLAARAPHLPQEGRPRPYYSSRYGHKAASHNEARAQRPWAQLQQAWVHLVYDMRSEGYLSNAAPESCVDGNERDPDVVIDERIQRAIATPGLWPPQPETWEREVFLDLVEVMHDLMARPRTRSYHDYNDCGWHYGDFAVTPGRALYRGRVNQLLIEYGAGLQLADSGEDAGRLVRVLDDAYADLVEAVRSTPAPADRAAVDHAIALFRERTADREIKRSAVVALARILEDRRKLIHDELGKKDEGDLFQIANNFDLRHRKPAERGDYDEAFLDWVFWWYLSTIRLTDKLRGRDQSS